MALPDRSLIFSNISANGLQIGTIALIVWQVVLVLASVLVNDVPEACVMVAMTVLLALLGQWYGLGYGLWAGCIYAVSFLPTSVARCRVCY